MGAGRWRGGEVQALTRKLFDAGLPLEEFVNGRIHYGIKTGLNSAFIIDWSTRAELLEADAASSELIVPFLMGKDVERYGYPAYQRYLILIPTGWTNANRGEQEPWQFLNANYRAVAQYLEQFKERAQKRWDQGDYWWELRPCEYYKAFRQPKIIAPCIIKSAAYLYDERGFYSNDKTTIIVSDDLYLLGLLNSKVLDFFMRQIASTKQGGYFEYKPIYLSQLPIRVIDFDNSDDVVLHDRVVGLVETALDLHRQLPVSSDVKRAVLEMRIEATDREIDALIYQLYALTDEERRIVEDGC